MRLGELISGLPIDIARARPGADDPRIGDITEDSRTALPGSLFVARPGAAADGRDFAHDAAAAGATAILTDRKAPLQALPQHLPVAVCDDVPLMTARLAERLFGDPSQKLLLVGVTGTNGKSTVTALIHQLLNRAGIRCGMISTVDVDDGIETAPAAMTTPPAIELSRTLATMVETGCHAAAVEISSHALDQKRADALAFDAAVFTNITGDHLDYHRSFDAYLAAKRRLLDLLDNAPGRTPTPGPAILNTDDPHIRAFQPRRPLRCAAHDNAADWTVQRTRSSLEGDRLEIRGPAEPDQTTAPHFSTRVSLFGPHNAINTLQALAAAWAILEAAGIEPETRRRRLADALTLIHPPRGRLEPVHTPADDIAVFVDFAHTHDAIERALRAVRQTMPARAALHAVFGCGGLRDRTKRPRMGRAAAEIAERVTITSDNPRAESPSAIVDEILAGIPRQRRSHVQIHIDRAEAIRNAIEQAEPGDAVVIAGKGHETEQILPDGRGGTSTRHFSDQDTARRALAERRERSGITVP